MNHPFLSWATATLAGFSVAAAATELAAPPPLPITSGPITVYRQLTPDGRVVYSDKAIQGAKIDHTITIEPPIKGNLWTTEAGSKPVIPPQTERTSIDKVPSIPAPGKKRTIEDINSDVIKAEMLLEDAQKKQNAGAARLPDESDTAYAMRQKSLAREVADAQAMFNKTIADRNALRKARYGLLP